MTIANKVTEQDSMTQKTLITEYLKHQMYKKFNHQAYKILEFSIDQEWMRKVNHALRVMNS
jgi:hypothetical protein